MRQSERGYTLIEILVVIAITALMAHAMGMSTVQAMQGSKLSNDHMTAIRQVQNAGYWISFDTQMARGISTDDNPGTPELEFITLNWIDWENGDTHEVIYTLHSTADGLRKLKRQHMIRDIDEVEIGNQTTLVAEYIDSATFSEQDEMWTLSIQARSGEETKTRDYEINPRVDI